MSLLLAQFAPTDDGSLARALAELGSAQSRLQTLDDDFYVRQPLWWLSRQPSVRLLLISKSRAL